MIGRPLWTAARRLLALPLAWMALLLLSGATPLFAQSSAAQLTQVQLGVKGSYKLGVWTPLSGVVRGGASDCNAHVEVQLADGDGAPSIVRGETKLISAGRDTPFMMYVKVGQAYNNIDVSLIVDSRPVSRVVLSSDDQTLNDPLSYHQRLIVMVGSPAPIDVKRPLAGVAGEERPEMVLARVDTVAELPTRWYGYEGVEAVVLATSAPDVYQNLSPTSSRIAALDQWVRRGGKLVIGVGKEAERVLAEDAPLATFMPGKFIGMAPLRETGPLEQYVELAERLDGDAAAQGVEFQLDVPRLQNVQGIVEAYSGGNSAELPLIVRTPRSFGQVVVAAVDFDRPPFARWKAANAFMDKLLDVGDRSAVTEEHTGEVNNLGYDDISGQLRAGLDVFEGVTLVPFSVVACILVVYILCIGPLDYFLLRRIGRMEWTWITFPTTALVFAAGAYFLAHRLKGNELRVNQVDVIDVDEVSGLTRGMHWSNLFSPRVAQYDLSLRPIDASVSPTSAGGNSQASNTTPDPSNTDASKSNASKSNVSKSINANSAESAPDVQLSWLGLPGDSFGGMGGSNGRPPAAAGLFTTPYAWDEPLERMIGVPIAVWSTKSFSARWSRAASAQERAIAADLRDPGDQTLSGQIVNQLPGALDDCVLLYDRWAFPLGRLEPGKSARLDSLDAQTVETYFKHATVVGEKSVTQPFERGSSELNRTMEVMLFYKLVGGQRYTGLSNDFQPQVDMSSQLKLGRAILFSRDRTPAARLCDGESPLGKEDDRRWTFRRFVLSVER